MNAGDIIRIIDRQLYFAQVIYNIWHYQIDPPGGTVTFTIEDLLTSFVERIIANLLPLQVAGLVHEDVQFINMFNTAETGLVTVGMAGTNSATATNYLPPYFTYGFLQRRENPSTRNGGKRISGVSDEDVSGLTYVGSGTDLANAEIAMSLGLLVEPTGIVATPVIVRFDATGGVAMINDIVDGEFRQFGTQNSRKVRLEV